MVLKTFSLNEEICKNFQKICKENGLNMSKQIELFMKSFNHKHKKDHNYFL